ncbi:uncharacterized protein BYT42DRAFT_572984 [Radiomyces spectabilis]|uniref:uncharacterized protein n=1 Tax=Radiomyces spectabilis TaxID=64574 RepID=UPI00221E95C7|nr:uncharacterized protein BYT42DRAFT_572984 [Radiomyces spectabilis]KAI8375986.1 hypothetical protein BYT42DRAFT_572984 [Radiomyces spectabilis]
MEKSFGNLLRHSRLATYDRTLPQVYTTPRKCKQIGDWGLKRNLPTVVRTPFVTIGDLDTAEHQTPWKSGQGQVLFVRRWKENFPNSKKPAPRSETVEYNVARMTPAEFQRFLKQASKKAPAFKEALAKKEVVPEQVFDYVNATFSNSSSSTTVGPTYSDHDAGWDYPVEGRILNSVTGGHAAGIAGVVALLPKRYSVGLRNSGDRKLRTFYVNEVKWDEEGRPMVEVKLRGAGETSPSLPHFLSGEYDQQSLHQSKFGSMSAHDMFESRPDQRDNIPVEEEDNSVANPVHMKLMERISGLMKGSKANE